MTGAAGCARSATTSSSSTPSSGARSVRRSVDSLSLSLSLSLFVVSVDSFALLFMFFSVSPSSFISFCHYIYLSPTNTLSFGRFGPFAGNRSMLNSDCISTQLVFSLGPSLPLIIFFNYDYIGNGTTDQGGWIRRLYSSTRGMLKKYNLSSCYFLYFFTLFDTLRSTGKHL